MTRHHLINRRNQLLELHVADQVLLVPPLGTVELPATDELPPELLELQRRLLVDLVPADEPEKPPQPKRATRRASTARRQTRSTSTRKKSAPRKSRGD